MTYWASQNSLNTWSFETTSKIKKVSFLLPQCLKQPRLIAWWPLVRCPQLKKMWVCEVTWQIKNIKSHLSQIPTITKLVRMVIYCEKLPLFNRHPQRLAWWRNWSFFSTWFVKQQKNWFDALKVMHTVMDCETQKSEKKDDK